LAGSGFRIAGQARLIGGFLHSLGAPTASRALKRACETGVRISLQDQGKTQTSGQTATEASGGRREVRSAAFHKLLCQDDASRPIKQRENSSTQIELSIKRTQYADYPVLDFFPKCSPDRARQFFNHVRHLRTKSGQEGNSEYNHGMTFIVSTPGESRCGLSLLQPCLDGRGKRIIETNLMVLAAGQVLPLTH
jgi:hypothetical protein